MAPPVAAPMEPGPAEPAAGTLRYSVLIAGRRAGSVVAKTATNGDIDLSFEYNDRGRGPKLTSRLTLDSDGLMASAHIEGVDYLNGPVDERFSRDDSGSHWSSGAEQGDRGSDMRAFYVAANASPFETGLLASALLRAPNGTLPLFPEGEARLERVLERPVTAPGSKRMRVTQVAIHGLGFTPTRVWLDEGGRLFALFDWFTTVREGYESVAEDLQKIQDDSESRRSRALAKGLGRRPRGSVVLRNASVFDPATERWNEGWTVVLHGSRIEFAGPDSALRVTGPEMDSRMRALAKDASKAEVIDATGKFVLPGLWDMHVHQAESDGLLQIACGITTARDMGNDRDRVTKMRAAYQSGKVIGPRLVLAGIIDGPGPRAAPTSVLVSTPAEAQAAVDAYARREFEQIKIYSSVAPSLVPVIVAAARAHHLRVSGHVPSGMIASEAVDAGYDEIQHVNYLMLNFAPKDADTTGTKRFTLLADIAAGLGDLRGLQVQTLLDQLKTHHNVVDPTVNAYESLFMDRPGRIAPGIEAVASWLPAQVRRTFLSGGLPTDEATDGPYRHAFDTMLKLVGRLHEEGISIEVGSDAQAGFGYLRELELHVKAGIPPGEVLANATLRAARIMNKDAQLGSIETGKLADLIVLDADPLLDMAAIRRTTLVVKDGVMFDPEALFAASGVRRPPLR